ncbi:MAG TPA: selenide, water dikinase SelD [Chitinophagaceae bacterium]|nr:selenide, water dikinase SelD [Chitinophagaceae bacterium]
MVHSEDIQLTRYSHGAGCGCKIAPRVLDQILKSNVAQGGAGGNRLLVGNHSRDDAAVYDLGDGRALISTTDFFMPIVDDPFSFGRIAAANAISDVYAMGGSPLLAIAILGWPVGKLPPEVAARVIEGGRSTCQEAGIPLAGGHSIDSPEPIFGLAVNGLVDLPHIKQNNTGQAGDLLYLTKPLGVGILTTAEKKGLLRPGHQDLAARQMMQLNKVGEALGKRPEVHAMTDVTGFGLLGHLVELAEGSGLSATLHTGQVPLISPDLEDYVQAGAVPGGTQRNWDSYGEKIVFAPPIDAERQRAILADPQTSGGLLIAVDPGAGAQVEKWLKDFGLEAFARPIGVLTRPQDAVITVVP